MEISVILLFLCGLVLVVFGSDILVDGASDIARRSGLSEFAIGVTIVGIGTSLPELVVSLMGSIQGNSDIAIGNVIGSNIFNTLLILGITSVILPLKITSKCIKRDIPVNIFATIFLILAGLSSTIFSIGKDGLGLVEGIIMLGFFVWYLVSVFRGGKDEEIVEDETAARKFPSVVIAILCVIGGLAGLVIGGKLFVNNAVIIAKALGWSDKFIAITILAGGTSLPELATCVVAAFKKKGQMALGNIIGSNIANIFMILGCAALVNPINLENVTVVDFGFLVLAAFFLLVANFTFSKRKLDRSEGIAMLVLEAIYLYLLINEIH